MRSRFWCRRPGWDFSCDGFCRSTNTPRISFPLRMTQMQRDPHPSRNPGSAGFSLTQSPGYGGHPHGCKGPPSAPPRHWGWGMFSQHPTLFPLTSQSGQRGISQGNKRVLPPRGVGEPNWMAKCKRCLPIAASRPRSCEVSSASQPATCLLPTSVRLPRDCKMKRRS